MATVLPTVAAMTSDFWVPSIIGCVLSLIMLAISLHGRRRQRLLSDLPTSKACSVFIGLVELKGTAEAQAPLTSFLARQPCVHYAYRVEEHWSRVVVTTTTDSKGRSHTTTRHESGWKTVADGGEGIPFYLQDDTGYVLIRPEGADIQPAEMFSRTVERDDPLYYGQGPAGAVADSDHRRRFVETGLPLHVPLYVVGQARERTDIVAPEIAEAKEAELFLISTKSEEKVSSGYAISSWVCWALGLVFAPGGLLIGLAERSATPEIFWLSGLAAATVYLGMWALGWVWMVFNSLVRLRGRVRQGWSLIEVELKRRSDLIPRLVATVTGLKDHERTVQTALAELRTQAEATPPGVAGPDIQGVAVAITAIVEKYPELKTQESFSRLHRELVTTEQRIALARSYYNDIATQFATRLEQVPDCFVARLGAMRPEPLLTVESFERAPVTVNLG